MGLRRRIAAVALCALGLCVMGTLRVEAASVSPSGTVTVVRPEGQLVLSETVASDGSIDLTITDTRAEDPGWSIVTTASPGATVVGGLGITHVHVARAVDVTVV